MSLQQISTSVQMEFDEGLAVLSLHHPPVNALNHTLVHTLFEQLEAVQRNPEVKAIVLKGSRGRFCAGFDITEFSRPEAMRQLAAALPEVHRSASMLVEGGRKPTVAAIERLALGGGLELAMACNARVCTAGAVLGLPELRLGIIPGFGGTQRLPRLVGAKRALEMMLQSEILKAEDAEMEGLVDVVVAEGELMEAAKKLALELAEGERLRQPTLERQDRLYTRWKSSTEGSTPVPEGGSPRQRATLRELEAVLSVAADQGRGLGRHGELCVQAVRAGVEGGAATGLAMEADCFLEAVSLDRHKALVQLFLASKVLKKLAGPPGLGTPLLALRATQHLAKYGWYSMRSTLRWLAGGHG